MRARLVCGMVLEYEHRSFLPSAGELVPCRTHGFCTVRDTDGTGPNRNRSRTARRRQRADAEAELGRFLERTPVTTIHVLRRRRFTLRVLVAAQAEGLLDLDIVTGAVRRRVR